MAFGKTAYHPDSSFVGDTREGTAAVWTYRVVVIVGGERHEADLSVWDPRMEPDRTDDGDLTYGPEWDLTTYSGTRDEISEEDADLYMSALLELVGDDLREQGR